VSSEKDREEINELAIPRDREPVKKSWPDESQPERGEDAGQTRGDND